MPRLERNLNILMILILGGVLLSAFGVQFILHEEPCPLCLLQRLGMLGVASAALLNIYFGARASHYGLALFSALFGGFVALRQITLHVCPGFPEFGLPVLGLSLYTWSFFVFVCVVLGVAVLLCLHDPEKVKQPLPLNFWTKFASLFILLIAIGNIISTFILCGWGPCEG